MARAKKAKLTPMMRQYMDVKSQHEDSIVFFRMGDFYEMFFDDAKLVARELDIVQTFRNKADDQPIPMAGVPHHSYRNYVNRLVEKGYTVVICDQVEDAKMAKGLVKRDVTRIITPGMVLDPDTLDSRSNHYLMAIYLGRRKHGLSLLDLTTGEFRLTEVNEQELLAETQRIEPQELLFAEEQQEHPLMATYLESLDGVATRSREAMHFSPKRCRDLLHDHFEVHSLEGFGIHDMDQAVRAAGAILGYVQETQRSNPPHISSLRPYVLQEFMLIDEVTCNNLELLRSQQERTRKGSLFGLLDKTMTPMGGRRLKQWILYPLLDLERIHRRHNAVSLFVDSGMLRETLREQLKQIHDLERLNGKIASGLASPRDLVSLRTSLETIPQLQETLHALPEVTDKLGALAKLDVPFEAASRIAEALVDEPPAQLKDGGFVRPGYHAELDEQRDIAANGKDHLLRMEAEEREETGIKSLKIKFNRVFGYYIEVTKPNVHLVPEDGRYQAKQTMVNHVRYITDDLKDFESKILGAEERVTQLEQRLFEELRQALVQYGPQLSHLASQLSQLDVLSTFAELAVQYDYVRPTMVEESVLQIEEGRHPVVEQLMRSGEFVPNDVRMAPDDAHFLLITGPNMAGKSTIMRQVALIALMGQIGSFVPARKVIQGACDRIFTRVGASDNLVAGQSTFMVEMTETSNILHNATSRSLVILDEIGRGTSTFDGISIAWAVAEYLHNRVQCRTMFATHYHELTELEHILDHLQNTSVTVREWEDEIVFLHKLELGGTSHSYGIEVARLAGLPKRVVGRSRRILKGLEQGKLPTSQELGGLHRNQLSLFNPAAAVEPEPQESPLDEAFAALDVNHLSPMEALQTLHDWKQRWG